MQEIDSTLSGVYAAAVTPMSDDGGRIATGAIGPLLHFLESHGLDGVLVLGSTGEFASLSHAEKLEVLSEAAATRGKLRFIVCCGSCAMPEVYELMDLATRRGADALLVPPPYYFRTAAPQGIESFFEAVLRRSEKPVILYHIPSLTGLPIDRAMLERLARFETLWGIKDSAGKLQETSQFLAGKPGRVLLGSDSSMLDGLKLGTQGSISACANAVPEWVSGIWRAFRRGEDASDRAAQIRDFRTALKNIALRAALKVMLKARGIDAGGVRTPLANLTQPEKEYVQKLALAYNLGA